MHPNPIWCPYKNRKFEQRGSGERPSENTGRRWSSTNQEANFQKKPMLPTP